MLILKILIRFGYGFARILLRWKIISRPGFDYVFINLRKCTTIWWYKW